MKPVGRITGDRGMDLGRKSIALSRQRGGVRFGRTWQFLAFHAVGLLDVALPRLGRVLD